MIALRAVQAALIVAFLLTAPTFVSLIIQGGGTALRNSAGW